MWLSEKREPRQTELPLITVTSRRPLPSPQDLLPLFSPTVCPPVSQLFVMVTRGCGQPVALWGCYA